MLLICNDNDNDTFILADEGFDVWMINFRGTTYSKAHVSLPPWSQNEAYWNFSWHEMAIYDLPATIFHINNITERHGELMYVGHSMGTTISFVFCSKLMEIAANLKLIVSLAPAAFLTNTRTPLRYLAPFVNDIDWIRQFLGIGELLPHYRVINLLSEACKQVIIKEICINLYFIFGGYAGSQLNNTLIPTILKHEPAGASTKTALHYLQEIKNEGNFQEYDYGPKGNIVEYGNITVPEYNLDNIENKFYFIYAENDVFANPTDVKRLSSRISNLVGMHEVSNPNFSHLDFLFGLDVYELVYEPMIKVMKNFSNY